MHSIFESSSLATKRDLHYEFVDSSFLWPGITPSTAEAVPLRPRVGQPTAPRKLFDNRRECCHPCYGRPLGANMRCARRLTLERNPGETIAVTASARFRD